MLAAGSSTPKEDAQRERFSVSIITRATRRTTPSLGRGKAFSALVKELPAADEEEAGDDDSYACSTETVAVSDRLELGIVSMFCLLGWPDVWQRFSSSFSETRAKMVQVRFKITSVGDSYVFKPPGSGSVSSRYGSGSGSFYHQAEIV